MAGLEYTLIALAALAGGAVNALAGGGTLMTFPVLTALGVPAVAANVTNTVALCPGYLGALFSQRGDLARQGRRLRWAIPAGALGGLLGGILLLNTGERLFRELVPYLILFASLLLAVQDPVRRWLLRRGGHLHPGTERFASLPLALASVYGGYFGAGVSVIILAALGLTLDDTLTRLNALKQVVALSLNIAAALFFLLSGKVVWGAAAIMALGALAGGVIGGRIAGRIEPAALRKVVVTIGIIVSAIYFAH